MILKIIGLIVVSYFLGIWLGYIGIFLSDIERFKKIDAKDTLKLGVAMPILVLNSMCDEYLVGDIKSKDKKEA